MLVQPLKLFMTLLISLLLATAVAACGGDDEPESQGSASGEESPQSSDAGSPAEGSTEIAGGRSVLELDPSLRRLLDAASVEVAPVGDASEVPEGIELPISSGELDVETPSGSIEHSGGIEFRALGRSLEARDLVISPEDGVVTAEVEGERISFLETDVGRPQVSESSDTIVLPNEVRLGDEAVESLNETLGVEVFEEGLSLGELTSNVERP